MRLLLAILLVCFAHVSMATHGRCGYIRVKQKNNSRTVVITVAMYTNTSAHVLFGGEQDQLNFGDGSPSILIPEQQNQFLPELDYNQTVGYASYTIEHTYNSYGTYVVSYQEPNRNAGILNIDNSIATFIYFESGFTIDETTGNYESPVFLNNPLFFSDASDFSGSVAAYDVNNYTLYYNTMTPMSDRGVNVVNYQHPTNYEINPINGLITWDGTLNGSALLGEFLTTVKIRQFDGEGRVVGYMNVDCQLIRFEGENPGIIDDDKELNGGGRIFTAVASTYSLRVFVIQDGSEFPSVEAHSELASIEGAMNFTTYDSSSGEQKIKVGLLKVTNLESLARSQPYIISIRGKFSGDGYVRKDINYTFYGTDTELPAEPEILTAAEPAVNTFNISPNPFTSILTMSGDGSESLTLNFCTVTGQHAKGIAGRSGETLNVHDLPPGMYVVTIVKKSGVMLHREKMIKQ